MKPRVLIVEDEKDTLDSLSDYLEIKGYQPLCAGTLKEAARVVDEEHLNAVILDLQLPDGDGLEWLPELREQHQHLAIIVTTGRDSVKTAVQAMREGADHFLTKPIDTDELIVILEKSLELENLKKREIGQRRLKKTGRVFFGESPAGKKAQELAATAAENDSAVLIQGETGTGKGVIARLIHENSERRDGEFVEVNCSGLQGDILASELFGHKKGSFTSAVEDREGLVEVADNGTLFLDEIGDMDISVQAKFLKVIEEKEFRRVGEVKKRRSNFRLICATNRNLEQAIEENAFRQDLYFRIAVFLIQMPSLKDRIEDLPGFVGHMLAEMGRTGVTVPEETIQLLKAYSWPGNIRELKNVLERGCILAAGQDLKAEHLPGLRTSQKQSETGPSPDDWSLVAAEVRHIARAMEHFNGDVGKAAQALDVSRATLYRKLKKYGIMLEQG